MEEIRLGPFSQTEVAEQISGLVGVPPPSGLVEEVYARAEGHPFFTEQLVAAGLTDSEELAQPVALPPRLAELLIARAARCDAEARAVLNALSVAGRPLTEAMLGEVAGLDSDSLAAMRELTEARLVATTADGGHRPRHALLAEAVSDQLLPGERVSLHERLARSLEITGDEALAAEAAGHWAAADRTVALMAFPFGVLDREEALSAMQSAKPRGPGSRSPTRGSSGSARTAGWWSTR